MFYASYLKGNYSSCTNFLLWPNFCFITKPNLSRSLLDFILELSSRVEIGGVKGGKTTVFDYLVQHTYSIISRWLTRLLGQRSQVRNRHFPQWSWGGSVIFFIISKCTVYWYFLFLCCFNSQCLYLVYSTLFILIYFIRYIFYTKLLSKPPDKGGPDWYLFQQMIS